MDASNTDLYNYISSSISEDIADIIDIVGVNKGCEIANHFAGENIYFKKDVARKIKYYSIIEDYKLMLSHEIDFSTIIKRLSRKYNFSDNWIRIILKREGLY